MTFRRIQKIGNPVYTYSLIHSVLFNTNLCTLSLLMLWCWLWLSLKDQQWEPSCGKQGKTNHRLATIYFTPLPYFFTRSYFHQNIYENYKENSNRCFCRVTSPWQESSGGRRNMRFFLSIYNFCSLRTIIYFITNLITNVRKNIANMCSEPILWSIIDDNCRWRCERAPTTFGSLVQKSRRACEGRSILRQSSGNGWNTNQ